MELSRIRFGAKSEADGQGKMSRQKIESNPNKQDFAAFG
jgi:hypothetical protein